MLRSIIFKNFVHYQKYQSVEFNDGFNLIIGRNGCGKSVIFELIRRCISTRKSTTIPTICGKKGDPPFAICRFSKLTESPFEILSGICMNMEGEVNYYVRFILFINSRRLFCCADKYECESTVEGKINIATLLTSTEAMEITDVSALQNYLEKDIKPASEIVHEILDLCSKFGFEEKQKSQGPEIDKSARQKLLNKLEQNFVATFPMRSIGPSQWTESKRVGENYRHQNRNDVKERAEIIRDLYMPVGDYERIDRRLFQTTLNKLTYPKECKIGVDSNDITIDEISLMRAPEGIVEAIQFALIFSCRSYKTVCLEEPDRGMHPEMVERLREIIFRSSGKAFILISHNISFLSRWTVPKTHVCVSEKETKNHTVVSFNNLDDTLQKRIKLITDTDDLKKILFSQRILCVEGKEDKIVIGSIFGYLMENLGNQQIQLTTEEIQFIASHQIIELGSCTNEENIRICCEALNVDCAFLLDLDAYLIINKVEKKKGSDIKITGFKVEKEKFKEFKTLDSFVSNPQGLDELIRLKENDHSFFWKGGRIEELILKSLDVPEFNTIFTGARNIKHPLSQVEFASKAAKEELKEFILRGDRNSILTETLMFKDEIKRFLDFMKRQ